MITEELKQQIDSHDIISFDIFDTLLVRPYVKPTDLFVHLEKLENAHGFATARIEAEQRTRKIHSDAEDITIDEVYENLADTYKGLKQKELDLERQVLQPNSEIKEIFEYAHQTKKRIVITSDMYLPREFVELVLHEKGYNNFEKIYISSQWRKTKWTGNLYKFLLQDLGVKSAQVLHIGDNKYSDYTVPSKAKIASFHYTKPIDRLFNENIRAKKFYETHENDLDASILLGLLTFSSNPNYWQDFGYKYAGPVILGYMLWLNKQLIKDNISEVLFVARDGYTLEKVFNLIKTTTFKTHYFYAPRALNLVCNLNYEHQCAIGEESGILALRTLLNYFKDKNEYLKNNTPEIQNCAEGINFINDNRKLFEKLSQEEKKAYSKYFEQFNITGNDVALIDTCSTFLSAQKALIAALPNKNVKGYYWFTWEGTQVDIEKYNTQTFQLSHKQEFTDWNMMEFFMTAPTPPVERIDNGKVIFKEISTNEQKRIDVYPDVSTGAVDFTKKYLKVFKDKQVDFDSRTLIDWVNVLCEISTKNDKEHFIAIQHAGDQQHTRWQPLPLPWFTFDKSSLALNKQTQKIYLLGIPLIKIKKSTYKVKISLFHFIPVIGLTRKKYRKTLYLFSIPVINAKTKANKTIYSLLKLLPILSIKRK